jgi:hypothetical protein
MMNLVAGAIRAGVGGFTRGRGGRNAPLRKRLNVFIVACALLAAPLLIPSAAHAVECSNGGTGTTPAGNDTGDATNTACGSNAVANGVGPGAVGASAFGVNSQATGKSSTAIGGGRYLERS